MKLRRPFKETQWVSRRVERAVRCRIKEQDFETSLSTEIRASLAAPSVKNLPATQEVWVGKIPWKRAWRLHYSCRENPKDWGDWRAIVYRAAKSQARLKRPSGANPLSTAVVGYLVQAGGCTSHGSTGWQLKLYARDMKDVRTGRFEDTKLVPVTFLNVWLMSSAATTAFWNWKMSHRPSMIGNAQICMLF